MTRSIRCIQAQIASLLTASLFLACNHRAHGSSGKSVITPHSPKITQIAPDANPKVLEKRLEALENHLTDPGRRLVLLAETGDPTSKEQGKVLPVPDAQHWPDDTMTSFVIAPNADGRPEVFQIVPQSESGDWSEMESFLFDQKGQVRFWRHEFSWFGRGESVNRYQIQCTWDASGTPIGRAILGRKPTDYQVATSPVGLTAHDLFTHYHLDAKLVQAGLHF